MAGGCRSQVGAIYDVATGRTTADDVLPKHPATPTPAAGVAQAAFAPPPLAGQANPASLTGQAAPVASSAFTPHTTGRNPLPEPTREQAFAAVLDDLQQIGMEDPSAQQELLRQLQTAQPAHWESIARRFRSTLALHNQLNGAPTGPLDHGHPETAIASRPQPVNSPSSAHSRHASVASYEPPRQSGNQARGNQPAMVKPMTGPTPLPPVEPSDESPENDSPQPKATPPATHPAWNAGAAAPDHNVRLASAESVLPGGMGDPQPQVIANPFHNQGRTSLTAPGDWRAHLSAAISDLESSTDDEPVSTAEAYSHARLRLLRLASGELDGAVTPIPGLPPTEQGYWSSQMFALSTMLDHQSQPEAKRRAAAAEIHLTRAQTELKQIATLGVRNLTFCDRVDAYGAYAARPSRRFEPGEEVTLYLEIENFSSDERSDGHHTVIGASYRVLDARGARVDGREYPVFEDVCLSRRRDFYMQYGMDLPERIYPGEYQLEMTLTDQVGAKIGRASIDFEIVDPRK